MPTVGWIFEDAVERFLEGQPRPESHVPHPVWTCKRCGKPLASPEELLQHYRHEHPLELPVLYVCGEPLPRETVIRAPLEEDDVELVQCSRCRVRVNGGTWEALSRRKFRQHFVQPVNSTWHVQLIHHRDLDQSRNMAEYHIRFRIPEEADLDVVDGNFLRTLVRDQVSHSDLEMFCSRLPSHAPEREYAGALGDYALGIMIKERRVPLHAAVSFEEFAVKMRVALEVLKLFSRPLARAVSAAVRFNLNAFNEHAPTLAAELETGIGFFCRILAEQPGETRTRVKQQSRKSSLRAICPVDQIAHQLLSACGRLASSEKLSRNELEALHQLAHGLTPISEQDLAKIHVICAEGYLRLRHTGEAVTHLRALQFNPLFRTWANAHLDTITPHGN